MRLWVVFACLAGGCLAQKPVPCASPSQMTGELTMSSQNEELWVYAKYIYDADGQRIRLEEIGSYKNKSFTQDYLLLFKQGIMYEINDLESTCTKGPLKGDFHPMQVPTTATLLGQVVLGSSSEPNEGLLVNTWAGDLPDKTGKYMVTVTEFGCIPISGLVHTGSGWTLTSLFNNVIGIVKPDKLNPPSFCPPAEMEVGRDEEPANFFSVLFKKH